MADKLKKNPFIPLRSIAMIALCAVCFLAIIGRLFYLQVMCYDEYQGKVVKNIQAEATVTSDRGTIYDSDGLKLATNYTVYRVFISPRDILDSQVENCTDLVCRGLSDILAPLGVTYDDVLEETKKISKADRTIQRNVEEEYANQILQFISENGLSREIHLEPSSKRYYPYGSLAAQTIGFVGTDGGLLGLELKYDSYLTGVPGRYITAKNARGTSLSSKYETYIEEQDGANLYTTLNMTLQHVLENQLKQTYIDSMPLNRVTGIVMNVKTFGVLAMATYPNFDLNQPFVLDEASQTALDALGLDEGSDEFKTAKNNALYSMWNNKAVNDLYEPGSTFKILTTAMAFEEDVVKWDDLFECPGYYTVAGRKIHCHKLIGHGVVTYARGLQQSCNPTLMQVAERVGRNKFYEYFQAFGYTEKTGIDLPGEASPIYHSFTDFGATSLAVYSFGQTFKISPIQQLSAICAVANGGYLRTPYVVERVVDAGGNVLLDNTDNLRRRVVSTEVCEAITKVLEQGVSTDGGAKNAYVPGYKIAAKTGTSEVRDILDEEGKSYLRVGSCVAYAPADDPQIAVIIIVDQPQCENIYGSYVAAPYVANFMSEALAYLGIEREYSDDELANLTTTLRNYVGLSITEVMQDLANRGITYTVKGYGDTLTYQVPQGGSTINKTTGKVILYCGDEQPDKFVTVPNIVGASAARANAEIINMGLNIVLEGATNGEGAVVVSQSPEAGTSVEAGSVVTVILRHLSDSAD